jgi:hypothetical protein
MNEPQFKIFGEERRKLKKELSLLKSFIRHFWHYHQLDKDMTQFYGTSGNYPMSDDVAQQRYDKKIEQIKYLESKLQEPYENIRNL